MTYQTLLFDLADGLAIITLNRPANANAMDGAMIRELMDVAIRCDEDAAIRAVLITGNGKLFSAGGDLKAFAAFGGDIGPKIKELTTYLHAAISRFARMDAPVIAAVNGMAAGAGMSLALACDLAIAAESAQFTMAYTAAALSPDGSASYYLPRLVGLRRAQELMLTNRRLSAREALEWGMINRVVADGDLMSEARAFAQSLAHGPTLAYGSVKKLLCETFNRPLETQMEMESRGIAAMTQTADGGEGIAAFLAKRKPEFKGR
ncbi:MAG: enoyl-CoA hydratase-related protein [Gammaproteobacteria bacterium]